LSSWERYSFPGNTRELRNIVIRLTTKFPGKTVSAAQLQDEFDPTDVVASPAPNSSPDSIRQQLQLGDFDLNQYLREQERLYIAAALELASGNVSEAAKLLGINRTTLHSRLGTHGRPAA
jgi:DNA-binding NtrC family response regulator